MANSPKIFKILITIIALCVSILLSAPTESAADCTWSSLIGDANGNGQITPGDALEIFWSSINGDWQSLSNYCCLDANKDSTVTPGDALMVFWYSIYGRPVEGVTGYSGQPCRENQAPVVSLPSQVEFNEDESAILNLNEYVTDPDNGDNEMVWSHSGMVYVGIAISAGVATFSASQDWHGTESVVLTAQDPGSANLSAGISTVLIPIDRARFSRKMCLTERTECSII